MRTLNKNKVNLWYVRPSGEVDVTDGDGNYTGEKTRTYTEPTLIKIPLYPADGEIAENIFGKDLNFDMISVSNDVELHEDGLLFKELPTANYDTTYDYKVSSIKESLNTKQYGLEMR